MHSLGAALVIATPTVAEEVQARLQKLPVRILLNQARVGSWNQFLETLERLRADVVLLELSALDGEWEDQVRRIRRSAGCPAVIVVHSDADPETILRVMRSGVSEYLCPPFDGGLQPALERISGERSEQAGAAAARGKTLAFLSAKGGCGATTAACHVAVNLNQQANQRVLLADFDLETGIVGFLMKSKSAYSVVDAMANASRLDLNYWKAIISNGIPGLEVIKAPGIMAGRRPVDVERLPHLLRFARLQYDWIVVDLGRGLGATALAALAEVDEAYLLTTTDVPALHQAKHLSRALRESGYNRDRLRLVLNRVARKSEITTAEIEQLLDMPVAAALPEDGEALYDSYADGKLLPAESRLGARLAALTAGISGVQQQERKRRISLFG